MNNNNLSKLDGNFNVEQNESNISDKDYSKLIAAQNESKRRLKIKDIQNILLEENKKKVGSAIAAGICGVAVLVATHFSGIDPNEAVATEIQALNSFESLKDYLAMITPAMYGSVILTAGSISSYIKHAKKYKKANREFYDMMENEPTDYQDIVENQAKSR